MIPIEDLEFKARPNRGLTEETARKWEVGMGKHRGETAVVYNYRSPDGAEIVAQKVRTAGKNFCVLGDMEKAGLHGEWLWRDGGKMVVLTEGEEDDTSVSQIQNHKWAVASVPTGAKGAKKAILKSLQWLEKFEKVVFLFDNDEEGRAASLACAEQLSPGKAFIGSLPLKDANAMLVAGRGKEVIDAIWGAKEFRPDGIVSGVEVVTRVLEEKEVESVPYPWTELNTKLRGIRRGEIVTFCAGSGMGKSQVCKEILFNLMETTTEKLGIVALEESVTRTALGFAALKLNRRVNVDRSLASNAELEAALRSTVGSGRVSLYDHFGSLESDNLLAKIRYMVRGLGCSTVLLDHISIVVSGTASDNERRDIDVLMTKLRSLVQELNCRMLIVSHLTRQEGKGHEEGGRTSLKHLRGSGSIGQLSDIVVGLERNQQDEATHDQSTLRILKNRFTGELGEAGVLNWDKTTGRLTEFNFTSVAEGSSDV